MVSLMALAFAATLFFAVYAFSKNLEREKIRLQWFSAFAGIPKGNLFFTWNAPLISFLTTRFVIARRPEGPTKQSSGKLRTLLKDSGLYSFCKEKEFFAFVLCLGVETALLFFLFFGFSFSAAFWGLFAGGAYPFIWVWEARRERFSTIRRDLPMVMDLLAVSVSAGLEMMQALERIAKVLPRRGLIEEIHEMLQELKVGKTRKEALLSLKERVPLPEMKTLISFLVQAIQLGTSMAPILVEAARQMRDRRFMEVEKAGIIASQKILFPLIFCILPAVFLTIFAPLLIRWMTGDFFQL